MSQIADPSRHITNPDEGHDRDAKSESADRCTCLHAIVARFWRKHLHMHATSAQKQGGGRSPNGLTVMSSQAALVFDPLRPKLIRIAYRMLGSVTDAEDVVQEAFLRWLNVDHDAVQTPEAYLRRVVTRLCLDQLKSARHRRETYIGPWLPEPVVEAVDDEIDDITLPLMIALERLSPLERAAFLLHDVFSIGFKEIAEIIGREPATCRQLTSRARVHVRAARPRFHLPKEQGLRIASAFFTASRSGDLQQLQSLLAADVAVYADGGGKISAALQPIVGFDRVIQLHASLVPIFAEKMSQIIRCGFINGLPGFVTIEQNDTLQTTALQIENGQIMAIYVTRNPDKLRHMSGHVIH